MTWRTCTFVFVGLLASAAWAEPPPEALTLDAALVRVESVPAVSGRVEAAKRRAAFTSSEASAVGQPQVTLQPGFRVFSESDRGVEGQVSYLHPLAMSDVGGTRLARAQAAASVLSGEAAVARRLRRREVVDAWVGAWAAGGAAQQAEAEWKEAQALRARVATGVAQGALLSVELAEAEAYEAEARLAVLHAEGIRFEAWLALGRAVGANDGRPVRPEGPLPSLAPLQPTSAPELARIDGALAELDATRKERVAQQAPQLGVGGVLQRESPSGFIGFATVQVTLPVVPLGVADKAAEESGRAALEAERDEVAADVALRKALARHEVEHKREELQVAREALLPAAEAAVKRREEALAKGAGTVLELSAARRRRVAALARVVELEAGVGRAVWLLAEDGEAPQGPVEGPGGP